MGVVASAVASPFKVAPLAVITSAALEVADGFALTVMANVWVAVPLLPSSAVKVTLCVPASFGAVLLKLLYH
tara:strand:+ start:644 stop:859 length:216 start_codon:yes stop_codon:yes gene_type:complete